MKPVFGSVLTPFAYGFRPFFLLAGWYALVAMGLWLWLYPAGPSPLSTLPAQHWHGHEMIFGFGGAAIAGFLLTAVPNWTGTRGFAGAPLIGLTVVWLAGRVAFLTADRLPFALVALCELAFMPLLAALIAPALLRTKNRSTPLLLVLLALWVTDAVFLYALRTTDGVLAGQALNTTLNLILMLVTVIGGRILPAFTTNALRARGSVARVCSPPGLDRSVVAAMVLVVVTDIVAPYGTAAGVVALAAGLLQAARLACWQGWHTLRQPIVWILHAAYAWLPVGLLMKAATLLGGATWSAQWMHALAAGAGATMILAVMTRAALGHTGRPLVVARMTVVGYGLLLAGVAVRTLGPAVLQLDYVVTVRAAGLLWLGAFAMYVIVYSPILLRPRADGKSG